jgi:hypothetical protein
MPAVVKLKQAITILMQSKDVMEYAVEELVRLRVAGRDDMALSQAGE